MYIDEQKNVGAEALSCLPISTGGIEAMLNHPWGDPHSPLSNKNPLD